MVRQDRGGIAFLIHCLTQQDFSHANCPTSDIYNLGYHEHKLVNVYIPNSLQGHTNIEDLLPRPTPPINLHICERTLRQSPLLSNIIKNMQPHI